MKKRIQMRTIEASYGKEYVLCTMTYRSSQNARNAAGIRGTTAVFSIKTLQIYYLRQNS